VDSIRVSRRISTVAFCAIVTTLAVVYSFVVPAVVGAEPSGPWLILIVPLGILCLPGIFAYMLTGGVHGSTLSDHAVNVLITAVTSVVWTLWWHARK
jgi:hypothetical protein